MPPNISLPQKSLLTIIYRNNGPSKWGMLYNVVIQPFKLLTKDNVTDDDFASAISYHYLRLVY